jgi:hypothetical protein
MARRDREGSRRPFGWEQAMSRKWKRSRQAPETPSGQWCSRPRELLESASYRVLSRAAHRVLSRIELELRYHAGKDNGRLPVTYEQFEHYGLDRGSIAPALRELERLGFIEITEHGRGGNAEYRIPNLFRLTYEPAASGNPTNEWKRFPGHVDKAADAEMMAEADYVAHMARKDRNRIAVERAKKLVQKNRRPVRKTHTGTSAENPHRKQKIPGAENPHYRVSGESHTTIDIAGRGAAELMAISGELATARTPSSLGVTNGGRCVQERRARDSIEQRSEKGGFHD